MPGAGVGDPYRYVVDETSFDFRGVDENRITDLLSDFCDTLEALSGRHEVAVSPWWFDVECVEGRELYEVLYGQQAPRIGRDARLRMNILMDRCPTWNDELPGLPDQVEIDGTTVELAGSVGYAWRLAKDGHHAGCLVFPAVGHRGWIPVTAVDTVDGRPDRRDVWFLAQPFDAVDFWRSLFTREDFGEGEFFLRVPEAFPGLVFAGSLSFRRFDGSYREMRAWVVQALSVVHDHFADALAAHAGQPRDVQAALGRFGLDLSPESPNTRAKPKVIRQRDVEHDGEVYRCEWHCKKEPNRNRIHFSLPDPRLGNRILVGIFVDHLDTE